MGTEMTDDWMDDGQAIGSMDSEDEEDATKAEEKPVEEPSKPPDADVPAVASEKPAGIALPITEMTDDWMDDDAAMGSMDSEDEDAEKQSNLALPQPSYASIASHEVTQAAQEPELPTTDE